MIQRLFLAIAALTTACASAARLPLDQPAPGPKPVLFAPGTVSTDEAIELNGVLSPDGREFFFTRIVDDVFVMHRSRLTDAGWSPPEAVSPYEGDLAATAVDMTYSADGDTLAFLGRAPSEMSPEEPGLDLWTMQREGAGWSRARLLPPPVSTPDATEVYPCMVADGSLYFMSTRAGGLGEGDVYRAQRMPDGTYAEPVNLGAPVNTEFGEGDTWVAPDESVLVLSSRRPGGYGMSDLYVSFRQDDGTWGAPRNLGPEINGPTVDYCPMGTWDGSLFFYSRRDGSTWDETRTGEVYWLSASFLEPFRR